MARTDKVQGFSVALPYSYDFCAGGCEKPCLTLICREQGRMFSDTMIFEIAVLVK